MKKDIDILDEIKAATSEERKMYIMHWALISLICAGVLSVCVMGFFAWTRHNRERAIHTEANTLYTLVENISDLSRMADNKTLSNSELVDLKYETDKNFKALKKLFHDGESTYAVRAGLILGDFALANSDYSGASYYFAKIADNSHFDNTLRDYAKLLLIQTKLTHGRVQPKDALSDIDVYFASRDSVLKNAPAESSINGKKFRASDFGVIFRLLHGELAAESELYSDASNDFHNALSFITQKHQGGYATSSLTETPTLAQIIAETNAAYADHMHRVHKKQQISNGIANTLSKNTQKGASDKGDNKE